ncbi:hypothetical protein Vretimale_16733 [Volvox reticuliferus]|uniref:Uncharacterized protein n=1 Tax=Volvox reticuliferus TaxID=1737510 RepID=A0A8J4GUQ0_9CHLO|nr:hypothetical protein Vretimale_16733 [Volvox reticuliferus]
MLDDKLDAKKASARDVDGDDAMEASDGEPPAKRVRAHAPQAAAAAVGAGPSSASRPRQRGKRPSSGGRGNARGDRRGHQQGRGGGVNPQSLTADQERELTRYYNCSNRTVYVCRYTPSTSREAFAALNYYKW